MTENFQLEEPWWRRFPVVPAAVGVLLVIGAGAVLLKGFGGGRHRQLGNEPIAAQGVIRKGMISAPEITECSGIAASRKHPGVYWVHNDGNRERLWAIKADGSVIDEYKVEAKGTDWEDIAIDDSGNLYIADVGNNEASNGHNAGGSPRKEVQVYQVKEPNPAKKARKIEVERTWKLEYPDAPFDCEALVVHDGYGFLISKMSRNRSAVLYRFSLAEKEAQTLERLGTLDLSMPVTAASISPDGKRMAVLSHAGVHVFRIDGEVAKVMGARPTTIQLMGRKFEGVCFTDEGLLVTAESREVMLVPKTMYEGTAAK